MLCPVYMVSDVLRSCITPAPAIVLPSAACLILCVLLPRARLLYLSPVAHIGLTTRIPQMPV